MPQEKYLLKIIAGPNQGAEVALGDEELVVGTSPECDFILSDSLVSPQHLKIVVSGEELSVTPLESPVYIDGEEIPKQFHLVQPFQIVSLGTTHFVIGPTEGEWPPLSAADVPTLKKSEKEEVESEESEKKSEEGEEQGEPKEKGKELRPEEGVSEGASKLPKSVLMAGAGITGLFLIILIGFIVTFFIPSKEVSESVDKGKALSEVSDKVAQTVQRLGVADDINVKVQGDYIVVDGWVKSNENLDELMNSLSDYRSDLRMNVSSQEEIINSVKDVLNARKIPVSVEGAGLGVVRVYGYYGDTKEWQKVKQSIENDVVGIKLLKDDVLTAQKLYPLAQMVLKEYDIRGKLQIIPAKEYILAKGLVSETDLEKVKQAMNKLTSMIPYPVPLKSEVQTAKADKLYFDMEIDSVIIGDRGIIITKDGERYFEGGVLPGGYVIEKISRDGILLKKGDQTLTLNIGDNYE